MDILALKPADTPDYMTDAWASCMYWAIGRPDIWDEFTRDTGIDYAPARNVIERAIDEASGVHERTLREFILWANVNVWGPVDGPPPDQN